MKISTISIEAKIGQKINPNDLQALGDDYKYSNYQHYINLGDRVKAQIYKGGTIVIFGIKDIDAIDGYWKIFLEKISGIIDVEDISDPYICNLVVTEELPYEIIPEKVLKVLDEGVVEYEPEQFSAIIWRVDGKAALIFKKGKVVIVGTKNPDMAKEFIRKLREKIEPVLL